MRPLRSFLVLLLLAVGLLAVPHAEHHAATVATPTSVVEPEVRPPHPRYVPPVASRSRPSPVPKSTPIPVVVTRHHRARAARLTASVPTSSLKEYAYSLVGAAQFACLEPLWQHESGWSVTNSYGSAYGIPQALPGSKMASEGADWRTNGRTQIRWGVKYIAGRYGTSCEAWAHYQAHSWY